MEEAGPPALPVGPLQAKSVGPRADDSREWRPPRRVARRPRRGRRLVDDEEHRAALGGRAMRLGPVGDLIADAGRQVECPAIGKLSLHLAGHAKQDVALLAP